MCALIGLWGDHGSAFRCVLRHCFAPLVALTDARYRKGPLGPDTNFHADTYVFPIKLSASFPAITSIFLEICLEISTLKHSFFSRRCHTGYDLFKYEVISKKITNNIGA